MLGQSQKDNKIIIITGQTATGKTSLGLKFAYSINAELVSFDSRQCYKYMDIITGKDTDKPIYMYDEYDPKERINAYDYISRADLYIKSIIKKGKIPIIVGGTMFYIKSYLDGLSFSDAFIDWDKRIELEKNSVEYLQKELKKLDKTALEKMNQSDKNNKRRLIRAIERVSDKKGIEAKTIRNENEYLLICLTGENKMIKSRIHERVVERIEKGALEEVKTLLKKGYSKDDPGIRTMGYSHLVGFLNKEYLLERAIELWTLAEYHYAKRQKVFLTKFSDKYLFDIKDDKMVEKAQKLVYKWL